MQKKPSQRKPSAGKKSVPERTGKRPTLVDASSFNLTEDEAALLALNEITISRYSLNFCLNDEIHDEMENTFRTTMCNMQRGLLKYLNTLLIVLLPFLTFAEFCFQFATENRWTPTVVNRLTISYTGNEEIFWFIIFLRSAICLFLVWVKMIKFFDSDAYYHRQKLMVSACLMLLFKCCPCCVLAVTLLTAPTTQPQRITPPRLHTIQRNIMSHTDGGLGRHPVL